MYSGPGDSEFTFELQVCRWAELAWHPTEGRRPVVVARQLGTSERRWDTVVIEVDSEAFPARRAFGDRGLDRDLLRVLQGAPAEFAWYRDALPDPGFSWRYVRAAVHRAADRGLVETRRDDRGRVELRRVRPYPDWIDRVIAIENKPDLDASAADRLADQLAHDVSAGLLDEAWVATDADVGSRALLSEFPAEAGVLGFDFGDGVHPDAAEVLWHPTTLTPDPPVAGPSDAPGGNPTRREELAERAYGDGWRPADTTRPDCRAFELRRAGRALLPYCTAKECHQTAAECTGSCSKFTPEPPAWRTKGPPIEGGPGKGFKRLWDRRRRRVRERIGPDE
ncbi:MAG: DUF5787 family protein [Halobaculum sp.]